MFKLLGEPCSKEEVGEIFALCDADGSGALDFRELVGILAAREQDKVARSEVFEAFRVLAKLQAEVDSHPNDERDGDISVAGCIGLEGITQALDSLAIQELKHDTALMQQVATNMLRWMSGPADTLGEVGSVGLDMYKKKLLQLAEGDASFGDDYVENPVTI